MAAWAELVNADGSDEWLDKCAAALVEVQNETMRRAARIVRNSPVGDHCDDCDSTQFELAALIDSAVTT